MMSLRDSACSSDSACTIRDVAIEEAGAVELAQDAHDAAGAMDVLDMHVGDRRRDLAQAPARGATAGRCRPW